MRRIDVNIFDREKDYPEAVKWWKHHDWTPPHLDFLPKSGWMAQHDGTRLAAVWLYPTGTKISWLEWLVANPDSPLKLRYRAIEEVIRVAQSTALQCGSTAIFTSVDQKARGLERMYTRHGFAATDRGVTQMIARIDRCPHSHQSP